MPPDLKSGYFQVSSREDEQEKKDTIRTDLLLANTQRVSLNASFCLPKGVDGMQREAKGVQPCGGKGWPMHRHGRHSTQRAGCQKQAAAAKHDVRHMTTTTVPALRLSN